MKKYLFLLIFLCAKVYGQPLDSLKFVAVDSFLLLGKITDQTETPFERLPAKLKGVSRPEVWDLGKNTSGLALRFASDATAFGLEWEVLNDRVFNHMSYTGIKGFDLYVWDEGRWMFLNSGRPTGKLSKVMVEQDLATNGMREYLLHFPLYDGLQNLKIGINAEAKIRRPKEEIIQQEAPVIFYGTSITQGACASRPGMAYPNIIRRELNREIYNLGFSGNGKLDLEIAELIAQKAAAAIVIDCVPNCTPTDINDRLFRFVEIIKSKQPETPIIFVENVIYPPMQFKPTLSEWVAAKNEAYLNQYKRIQKAWPQAEFKYLKANTLLKGDMEHSVDGIHLTDYGFMQLSERLLEVIQSTSEDI
ncbi:SGNH/GDSL hydrolase family protein [Persicobacter diffluens]|uniref:Hydrolase n=1 Tax=Persicobacter diffluens TaxID=981 RepID=A0AAN4W1K0_9BACT|nr:hydrolase [Persicobacter diffluens]